MCVLANGYPWEIQWPVQVSAISELKCQFLIWDGIIEIRKATELIEVSFPTDAKIWEISCFAWVAIISESDSLCMIQDGILKIRNVAQSVEVTFLAFTKIWEIWGLDGCLSFVSLMALSWFEIAFSRSESLPSWLKRSCWLRPRIVRQNGFCLCPFSMSSTAFSWFKMAISRSERSPSRWKQLFWQTPRLQGTMLQMVSVSYELDCFCLIGNGIFEIRKVTKLMKVRKLRDSKVWKMCWLFWVLAICEHNYLCLTGDSICKIREVTKALEASMETFTKIWKTRWFVHHQWAWLL